MAGNRPEARALRLEDLDHFQQEAIEKTSKSLLSALSDLSLIANAGNEASRDIDPFRASRLFFISGEPGGGKTTVYLSLREALKKELTRQKIPDKIPSFKKLEGESYRLVWLEPLDLEPASEATNFLAAVLVRIEDAADKMRGRGKAGDTRKPGLLEVAPKRLEGFQELKRLQSDVVLAWDGNVAQRAGHLDSDVYALEVLHVEKARLNVNARLQETLEGVLPDESKGEEALFVLPVDDFYLRPGASLSLLRLLRMISVPRLFILILGDLNVVEELFYQDLLGQLVRLAGEQVFTQMDRQKRILTARASALSAHALRKLVPLAQRYKLQVMFELRALDFSPAQLDRLQPHRGELKGPERQSTLENLLRSLPVCLSPIAPSTTESWPSNFLEFLCLRSRSEEVQSEDYTYSGLAILDLPPREVVDLWFSLDAAVSRVLGKKEEISLESTCEIVIQQTLESLAAQTYLSLEDQKWCEDAIQGSPDFKRFLATDVLKVESQKVKSFSVVKPGGVELEIFRHRAWVFRPKKSAEDGGASVDLGLAPRPRAWFTVLHDLLALSGEDRLLGGPLPPRWDELGWVRSRIGKDVKAWPLPDWPSFWHLDRFGFAWGRVIDQARGMKRERKDSPDALIAWLAYHWIRFATDVLLSNRAELNPQISTLNMLEPAWEKLAEDISNLVNSVGRNGSFEGQELVEAWVKDLRVMHDLAADPALRASIDALFQKKVKSERVAQKRRRRS